MSLDLLHTLSQVESIDFASLSDEHLQRLAQEALELQQHDRQVNQLRYYQPVSQVARDVHTSTCKIIGIGGGNGASKTDTALVEMVVRCTGQIPLSLKETYPVEKLKGPINCRVVCESLTTTLAPVILPKLQWYRWNGLDRPGGQRGHYGWIPKHCLIKGEWKESWTERTRTLQLYYRDYETDAIEGISTIQFMSYDQDPSDFASGDIHFCLHDEPPKEAIWVENLVRVKRVDGTQMLSMTWPDDPTIPVDWILDRVYEPAQAGKDHDTTYAWFNMYATDNMNLNQTALAELARTLSKSEQATRIYGQPIRLSNRVHPLFTDTPHVWCFECHDLSIRNDDGQCGTCGSDDVCTFCHVQQCVANPLYPVINVIDPHPRKPHMLCWVQVTPNDDLEQIHELEVTGSPQDVAERVTEIEGDYGWKTIRRLIDPNMGRSPSGTDRTTTWQDSFEACGLAFDLADDSDVGRQVLNDYLKPDAFTRTPRYTVDQRCLQTIYQMKRYSWDDHKRAMEKDQKQRTKTKHDDYPTMLKYLANTQPTFRGLKDMGKVHNTASGRVNGY